MDIERILRQLDDSGNFRRIPDESDCHVVDLSSNDYLGLADRVDLRETFFADHDVSDLAMSSSASRLLGGRQRAFRSLENTLSEVYGRDALLFNSGYHANVGLIQAVADKNTLIVADRLVHASIIDGIRLSGAPFERFRHNDYEHLRRILSAKAGGYSSIVVIAESVYSMDGDCGDIDELIDIKRSFGSDKVMLYVDEAHAVGVVGRSGLGLVSVSHSPDEVDIVVGTFGKAFASVGAYAILAPRLRDFMINRARSFIFSTALPPISIMWSEYMFRNVLGMDDERSRLRGLSRRLADILGLAGEGHIRPLIVGDPHRALTMSSRLMEAGYKVLPIRTPTVPPGTERLRFSLSASIEPVQLDGLAKALAAISHECR